MRRPKIKKGLSRLSDPGLITAMGYIVTKMEDNVNFPDPTPPLAEIEQKRSEFKHAMNQVQSGNKTSEQVVVKKRLRTELMEQADQLFAYITNTTSDVQLLTSTGFPLAKERERAGALPAPK